MEQDSWIHCRRSGNFHRWSEPTLEKTGIYLCTFCGLSGEAFEYKAELQKKLEQLQAKLDSMEQQVAEA